MSYVDSNEIKIGESATQSQNFKIRTNNDGTFTILRADGSQNILSCDANGVLTSHQGLITGRMVLGTAQATTSGTSIDFTGIPSWVKRITVMLNGVSTSGASHWLIKLGTSSGIDSTNYSGHSNYAVAAATGIDATSTTGFILRYDSSSYLAGGCYTITKMSDSVWVFAGISHSSSVVYLSESSGIKTGLGILDRIRLTTVNGTDTFDAGSVNIMYEG